jgi:hypothetical protein
MPTVYPIIKGDQYMNAVTYTGNGSTQTIGGYSFSPDFVWVKERSSTSGNVLFDIIRGATNYLESNTTGAEAADASTLTSFNSNGFSVGSSGAMNQSSQTYVGWAWDANGTAVSNTAGSITSSVSANTTSGFSVVTYTGTGTAATIGHGLSSTPRMIIVKRRNSTSNWAVYHRNAGSDAIGFLNTSDAFSSPDASYWNATGPTSSVFSIGTNAAVNASGGTYVAYCFAEVAGYSSINRYTGNGSTDGTFVYTGFRPRYIMIKNRDAAGLDWYLLDTARNPYNQLGNWLITNGNRSEGTTTELAIDFLSNGFKLRNTGAWYNANGNAYMYMAFAEMPTKYANAR